MTASKNILHVASHDFVSDWRAWKTYSSIEQYAGQRGKVRCLGFATDGDFGPRYYASSVSCYTQSAARKAHPISWPDVYALVTECALVHAHDFSGLSRILPAVQNARAEGRTVRLVYDAHEYASGMASVDETQRESVKAQEAEMLRHVDLVVTVSSAIAGLYENMGARKAIVTYNSPPLSYALDVAFARVLKRPLARAASVALVGGPAPSRCVEETIRAAKQAGFQCYMCGPFPSDLDTVEAQALATLKTARPEQYKLDVWEAAKTLIKVYGRTQAQNLWLGKLEHHNLARLLASEVDVSAVCLSNPRTVLNHKHSMPNKLFESLLAGVPMVGHASLERSMVCGQAYFGLDYDERPDVDALADRLEEAAHWRPDTATLRRQAEHYCWEAQGRKLRTAYAALDASLVYNLG